MNPITSFLNNPCLFWSSALIASLYYGVRGVLYQRYWVKSPDVNCATKTLVQYIQDFIYNFLGSMAGFGALILDYRIYRSIADLSKIETGTGFLMSFLTLLAIIGMSGALPRIIWQGHIFKGS
jgi:hypothetical protein